MSEFTPIESQEALNKIIEARLARQKESFDAKYGDYDKTKTRLAELETAGEASKAAKAKDAETIASLQKQVSGFETASLRTKIALKNGLPYDLADRLIGDDEASIQADAERLAGFVGTPKQPVPPLKDPNMNDKAGSNGAYKSLLESLNLEGE